jgi:hypothetical protein
VSVFSRIFGRAPSAEMRTWDVLPVYPADAYTYQSRPDRWRFDFPTTVGAKFVSLRANQPLPDSSINVLGPGDHPFTANPRTYHSTPRVNRPTLLRHGGGTASIPTGVVMAQQMHAASQAGRPQAGMGPGHIIENPVAAGAFNMVDLHGAGSFA